jgi:hypothetical protein
MLVEDGAAGAVLQGCLVTEPADAAHGAEIMVDRAILLHQDHDVLDVVDATRATWRRDRFSRAISQRDK